LFRLRFIQHLSTKQNKKIPDVSPPLNVLHLYGTPYQMGFAHGTLLKKQINELIPLVMEYIDEQVQQ